MRNSLFSVFGFLFLFVAHAEVPKYVFLFIGDGMSTPQRMLAHEYALALGQGPLAMNTLPTHALTRTRSASSVVTDSAASGTALACGAKTNNGYLGVDAHNVPLTSCAEIAHQKGVKVGIVTTCRINHATPGAFYAHRNDRNLSYQIGLDLLASGFDYFAGGGFSKDYDDTNDPFYRGNLNTLVRATYRVATTKEEFVALQPGTKALYQGCEGHLSYAIDDDLTQPTLAEMTQKGIDLLQDSPKGFFMMIEGGLIDYFAHDQDAAGCVRETLAFDEAVRVALKFQAAHAQETLVIVTADHETGGLTEGADRTGYALYVKRLSNQKMSIESFQKWCQEPKNKHASFESLKPFLTKQFGFDFSRVNEKLPMPDNGSKFSKNNPNQESREMHVTQADEQKLQKAFQEGKLPEAVRALVSDFAGLAWTSHAHTALPVLTTSKGPGSEAFTGLIENSDVGHKLKALYQQLP